MTPNPKIVFKTLTADYYSCCTIVNNVFIQKLQLCSENKYMFEKLNVHLYRYLCLYNLPSRFALF